MRECATWGVHWAPARPMARCSRESAEEPPGRARADSSRFSASRTAATVLRRSPFSNTTLREGV